MEGIKKWREITLTLVSADSLPPRCPEFRTDESVRQCRGHKLGRQNYGYQLLSSFPNRHRLKLRQQKYGGCQEQLSCYPNQHSRRNQSQMEWNFPLKLVASESELFRQTENMITCLLVFLFCKRSFGSDKHVGHAIVPLKDLIDESTHQLLKTTNGTVTISVDNISECSEPKKPAALRAHLNLEEVNKGLEIVLKLVQAATDVLPKIIAGMQ